MSISYNRFGLRDSLSPTQVWPRRCRSRFPPAPSGSADRRSLPDCRLGSSRRERRRVVRRVEGRGEARTEDDTSSKLRLMNHTPLTAQERRRVERVAAARSADDRTVLVGMKRPATPAELRAFVTRRLSCPLFFTAGAHCRRGGRSLLDSVSSPSESRYQTK